MYEQQRPRSRHTLGPKTMHFSPSRHITSFTRNVNGGTNIYSMEYLTPALYHYPLTVREHPSNPAEGRTVYPRLSEQLCVYSFLHRRVYKPLQCAISSHNATLHSSAGISAFLILSFCLFEY